MTREKLAQKVGNVLKSPPRVEIFIALNHDDKRFSELQTELGISNSNLTYHLTNLRADEIVEQVDNKYSLSKQGKEISSIIEQVIKESDKINKSRKDV